MSTWLPTPSLASLVPPSSDHPFFDFAQRHPFESAVRDYSPVNAAWLADLALLAYDDPRQVAAGLRRGGLSLSGRQPIEAPGASAQCYVAHDAANVLVAFRGSEVPLNAGTRGYLRKTFDAVQDTLTNLRIALEPWPQAGPGEGDGAGAGGIDMPRVHAGFAASLEAIWPALLDGWLAPLLAPPARRRLWLTGHSLGAALATLAASRVDGLAGLYGFGAPRVGDARFAARLDALPAWRVVLRDDLITRVPPAHPPALLHWVPTGYRHGGTCVHIDAEGRLRAYREHEADPPAGLLELAAGLGSPVDFLAGRATAGGGLGALMEHLRSGQASREAGELARMLYDHAPLYYALTMRHLLGR